MLSFSDAIRIAGERIRDHGQVVHPAFWQGMDVSSKPEMDTWEILNHSLCCPMVSEDLRHYREEIKPNIPWADDHFEERVSGFPLNPGEEWRNWPYAASADRFRDETKRFSHSYMERYWPKYAGMITDRTDKIPDHVNRGIWYEYGDLSDTVKLLVRDPLTRQAYVPVFFPEDTGAVHRGRIPCSIGYHFIRRNGYLHCVYQLRSCDYVRHFRDDIYLTVRLVLWVLDRCREFDPVSWDEVKLGLFTMHITSLHIFRNDRRILFGKT